MREIIITRPRRFECAAVALRVEVNGKRLAKLKNGQRIVMNCDDDVLEIRVCGGVLSGKAFQDKLMIPAGVYSYALQVDFISAEKSGYLPLLRPAGQEWVKDDNRTITLMGATLSKLLLDGALQGAMRRLPGARLFLVVEQSGWQLILRAEGLQKVVYQGKYSTAVGGLTAALVNALEHGDLGTPEGRAKICDKVLTDYACRLPEYIRAGEDCIAFKG